MKAKTIWIIVGVIVLLIVLYLIYKSTNKTTTTTTSTTNTTNGTTIPPRTVNSGVQRFMQTFNPYPQSYLDSFENKELIRTVNGNGSGNKEVFVGSNYGTLKCPKGQVVCSRDPNSCCQLVANNV